MAESMYLSYEQVLQALQTNRGQLNQFIRSGRLRQHVVDGETKFRRNEVEELKNELEKEPTVMEDAVSDDDGTALLDGAGAKEPETAVLEEGEVIASRTTDVLEESSPLAEPDTVMLEEDVPEPDTVMLEDESASDVFELEESDGGMSVSDSALETELDLKAGGAAEAVAESDEEDFFDFSGDLEDVEFELEGAAGSSAELEPQDLTADSEELIIGEDTEDVVTEVLNLGGGSDIAEEDLLSEIMEIDDEGAAPLTEDSADITAEITTMEEPTYEESDLDELLEAEEDVGAFEEEFTAEEEFEVPYAAAMAPGGDFSVWDLLMLLIALVFLALGGIFMVENSVSPEVDSPLTSWMPQK